MDLTKLEFHELANEFPLISDEQAAKLANDIAENGLIEPLTLYDGQILDGRNRYNACKAIGRALKPEDVIFFEQEYEDTDPVSFVLSKNVLRRHLTVGQREHIAAELYKRMPKQKRGPKSNSGENLREEQQLTREERLKKVAQDAEVSVSGVKKVLAAERANKPKPRMNRRKIDPAEHDSAVTAIQQACGAQFWELVTMGHVAGLKSPAEVVAFGTKPAGLQKLLSGIMYWGQLSLAGAEKFRTSRLGKELSLDWTLQELLALMGAETAYTESFKTRHGEYRLSLELLRGGAKKK